MAGRFEGRSALVTGAASGIGAAVAHLLPAEGAGCLILVDRDAAALEAVTLDVETIRIVGDVADEALWDRIDLTRLDHAVVNAGVAGASAIVDAELAAMATPLGRYAKAEEVAAQIAFLLGDASAMMTGATLLADGGYTL